MGEINKVAGSFGRYDSKAVSTAKLPFGGGNMFTSLRETTPASEYRNAPSRSFVFNGCSIHDCGYFVSEILAGEEVILRNSNSDGIEETIWTLQKYASILGQIYKIRPTSGGRSGKRQSGSVILSSDYLEPYNSQLSKSKISLSKKSGAGSCYADRDSDTLSSGGRRDRLFGNK